MSSRRALLELTTRLLVAWPAMSPPIRKKTSWTEVGLLAWLALEPAGRIWSSVLELVEPASNSRPWSRTPSTSETCMVSTPPVGMRVGKPRPRPTVFCAAVLDGVAKKNVLIGTLVPGVLLVGDQLGPTALVRRLGSNTL